MIPRLSLRLRTRPAAVLGLAAASVLGAAVLWPLTSSATPPVSPVARLVQPVDPPTGPVEITGVDAPVTSADSRALRVTIRVRNLEARPVDATVWWLLARPDQAQPWTDPVARGEAVQVTLGAHGVGSVVVPGMSASPSGVWTLSLWAHTNLGLRASHGANVTPLIQVLPTYPDVFRRTDPGQHAALTVVEPVGRLLGVPGASGPDALVSVQAATQQPLDIELRCYLAPPGTAEPWRRADAVGSYVQQVTVDVSAPTAATCRFPELPAAGTWELSAFLRRSGGPDVKRHEDGLYSRQTINFQHESGEPSNAGTRPSLPGAGARSNLP